MHGRRAVSVMPRSSAYESSQDNYAMDDSINRAEYFSNAVLEDTYNQALSSRGRDDDLLRSANATIRPSRATSRIPDELMCRPSSRFKSLPAREDYRSSSLMPINRSSLMPYRNDYMASSMMPNRSFDITPSPGSLLSSKIAEFLQGGSRQAYSSRLPPSSISYTPASVPRISYSDYRSYEPLYERESRGRSMSSSRVYPSSDRGSDTHSQHRYGSNYVHPKYSYEDEVDYEETEAESPIYKKYHISRSPRPVAYSKWSDDDDISSYGEYESARPYDGSYVKLSTFEGPYDGSYEADMAEMYDYVPFGPSQQGILELQSYDNITSDTNPITDRRNSRRASSPSVTLLPYHSNDSITKSHTAAIDTLVSKAADRARSVLRDSNVLPEYNNASLVLSVEGSALAEDGNRYNFKYFPPPVPLKGGSIGLDERILGISPTLNTPADTFVGGYLDRLRNLRTDDEDRRSQRGSSVMSTLQPQYSHQTIDMPLNIAGRKTRVPVSSYRSRLGDGQSHQVDVYPLVETEAAVPSSMSIPAYRPRGDGPARLSVVDKINIKAAIIGSRMGAGDGERRRQPRTQYAANKQREVLLDDMERKYK